MTKNPEFNTLKEAEEYAMKSYEECTIYEATPIAVVTRAIKLKKVTRGA